jgi:hypothetical protein
MPVAPGVSRPCSPLGMLTSLACTSSSAQYMDKPVRAALAATSNMRRPGNDVSMSRPTKCTSPVCTVT